MVGGLQADHGGFGGVDLGHLQGEVVGLGAGVAEGDDTELRRELFQQLVGGLSQYVVEEAGVGLQHLGLLIDPSDKLGMAMSNVRHIVDTVQILLTVLLIHDHSFGMLDLQWVGVV